MELIGNRKGAAVQRRTRRLPSGVYCFPSGCGGDSPPSGSVGGSQRCRKGEESGDAREGGPPAANVDDGVPKLRQMPCDGREEEEEDRGVSG